MHGKQPRVRIPDLDLTDSLEPGDARIVSGSPSDDEIAAIAATLGLLFEGGVAADKPRDRIARLSPWQQTQRPLRGGSAPNDPLFGRYR